MNIFDKFYPGFILEKDANIIVIDNGDGEIVSYGMKWRDWEIVKRGSGSKCWQLHLSKRTEDQRKLATILVSANQDINSPKAVLYSMKQCQGGKPAEKYFTHYKRLPSQAGACYITSNDKNYSNIKYEDLMAASFNIILEGIFDKINYSTNISEFDEKMGYPTYIFVGRPSSEKWDKQEVQYQKLLASKLHDYSVENNATQTNVCCKKDHIKVFLVAEADAAFAQLVCRERNGKHLPENEYVIMIDMGSSTVDITVVKGNKVIVKDSRTIGGGDLDRCLLDCVKREANVKNVDEWVLFTVRAKKEAYFNEGEIDPQVIRLSKESVLIDENLMQKAISETKVYSRDEDKEYLSWKEVIIAFYEDVRKRISRELAPTDKDVPSKILVTGGVSNMPCVLDWATDIFGAKAERSENTLPSDSVALGLSYIAEKELQIEAFRQQIRIKANKLLDSKSGSFSYCMAYGEGESVYKDVCDTMEKWYGECYDKIGSLKDYIDALGKYTINDVTGPFGRREADNFKEGMRCGIRKWISEEKIQINIEENVRKKFQSIFPNSSYKFSGVLKIDDAVDQVVNGKKKLRYWYHTGILSEILSTNYAYCYDIDAPKNENQNVVEKEGFLGIGRKEHTLYSVWEIRERVKNENNKERIIKGLSSISGFQEEDNAEFRKACDEIISVLKEQILISLEKYIAQITPYKLL